MPVVSGARTLATYTQVPHESSVGLASHGSITHEHPTSESGKINHALRFVYSRAVEWITVHGIPVS